MLKLGTTDINKIYLGSTEINKAYLGSTEVYSVSSDDLPIVLGANSWHNFTDQNDWIEGDTDKVGSWLDKTSNNNDLNQSSGFSQPGFTSPNGPITFDGNNDYLEDLPIPSTNYTWLFKVKVTASVESIVYGSGTSDNSEIIWLDATNDTLKFRTFDEDIWEVASGVTILNNTHVYGLVRSGNSWQWYVNGSAVGSPFTDSGTMLTLSILGGRSLVSGSRFSGDMFQQSTYPSALTAQNISDLTDFYNS